MKHRRLLSALLCAALLLTAFYTPGLAAAAQTAPFAGQGTAEDPYRIENARQLWALAGLVNAGAGEYAQGHYRLTANLDLGPADWVPIGLTEATPFRGVFDGDGHGVATLWSWEEQQADYGGLFGVTEGAVIDDLYVEGNIGGQVYAGQLVAWAKDSQIKNCAGKLNTRNGPNTPFAPQLVGRSDNSRIENCAYSYLYGSWVVGTADAATRVVNSFSAGTTTNFYYHADGAYTQVWAPGNEVSQGQTAIATSYSDFVRELNAWVDAQPAGVYRHWRAPDGAEEMTTDANGKPLHVPALWPVPADYLVEVRVEAPGADQETLEWLQGRWADTVRGCQIPLTQELSKVATVVTELQGTAAETLSNVYAAQAGCPPCITGLDGVDGFRLAEVYLDGQAVGPQLPAITEDCTLTLSFVRSGDMAHFTLSHPDVEYPDVAADAWYGAAGENTVSDVTRLGFFVGRDDGCFAPEAPLTLAEAVKLAAVAHSTYAGDGDPFDQTAGEHWYDTYKEYAVQAGILYDWEFGELTQPATRLQMAYLFRRAIPQLELVRTPGDQQRSPSDIEGELERYQWSVRDLYWYGVLQGADEAGNFYPDRTVTRAEAAAILVRLALPERRLTSGANG